MFPIQKRCSLENFEVFLATYDPLDFILYWFRLAIFYLCSKFCIDWMDLLNIFMFIFFAHSHKTSLIWQTCVKLEKLFFWLPPGKFFSHNPQNCLGLVWFRFSSSPLLSSPRKTDLFDDGDSVAVQIATVFELPR